MLRCVEVNGKDVLFSLYSGEHQLESLKNLAAASLPEPYSLFTFRYFTYYFGDYCHLAHCDDELVAMCLASTDGRQTSPVGCVAIMAVADCYRRLGFGSILFRLTINAFLRAGVAEIELETEITNKSALKFYASLGFKRVAVMPRYYLSGGAAYRLSLRLQDTIADEVPVSVLAKVARRLRIQHTEPKKT
eukprot:Lankesteria_metandrocarpae@DN4839_c0_g1_i2.p2